MEAVIEYKGRLHVFKKPMHLTDKMFQDRCWLIVKNSTYPYIENYADMWISWKYFDIEYTKDIMEKLKTLQNNLAS
jgi:hypothetical protein